MGILSIVLALGFVACRAVEMQPTFAQLSRIAVSLGVIAFVCFAPFQSFLKRAATVVAVEAVAGIVMFGLVDAPVVLHHRAQIVGFAVSLQSAVAHLERRASNR